LGTQGLLTKDKFGYSMPVDAPLNLPPPLFYEDTRIMLFPYLTRAAQAAALLPAPLELVTVDPDGTLALASMLFAKYPFSTVGAYNEVGQNLAVTYKGQPGTYAVRLHVTNDQAMVAGREIGGFPKRLGDITFDEGAIVSSMLECPAGIPVCSAELTPIQPVPWLTALPMTFFALRVLPNPADPRTPSICELVKSDWLLEEGTFWSARGMTTLTGASASNPYHALPIVELLPPMNPQASTPQERETPGLVYYRGKMHVTKVSVAERL
jgi:acetoacetate decarboxylase